MTDMFARYDNGDVRDLVAESPLAWLLAPDGRAEHAAQLPLLGEYDSDGALMSLLGHIPRRHPLVPVLERDGRALVLFQGPQSYISPDQAGLKDWAPTWNFVQLSIETRLEFLPDEIGPALTTLVRTMEAPRPDPWDASALGDRYGVLASRVIAFRAHSERVVGRFKLGQDERPEVRNAIIRSLGDAPIARWMRRFDRKGQVS